MLTDYRIPPAKGGKPGHVVIFLHGVGDSGSGGLLTIGQIWREELPDCEFICPDAPFPYDMAPEDFGGRQWFSLQDRSMDRIMAGIQIATPILNEYIDHVLKTRELAMSKIALVGFSQGGFMSLHISGRRSEAAGCVISYAGMMPGADRMRAEKKSSPPVLLVHGMEDEVVPFAAMAAAEQALKDADIPVTTLACPNLGHSIDDRGIAAGLNFLKMHLK